MTSRSVLENPQWALGVVRAARSGMQLILNTLPGVVGGEFHAELRGVDARHRGSADVTLTCTAWDGNRSRLHRASTPNTYFHEIERVKVQNSGLEIRFLIPFEARGSEEGATWSLAFEFSDGSREVFEVPVCRTEESNPEVNEVQISLLGPSIEESKSKAGQGGFTHKIKPGKRAAHAEPSKKKAYVLEANGDGIELTIPGHVSGRPSMVRGAAAILTIWVVFTGFVVWLIDEGLQPWLVVAVPAIGFAALLLFAWFGESLVELKRTGLVRRFRLFGFGWTKRWELSEIQGFNEVCVGKIPAKGSSQISYMMMMKDQSSNRSFLAAGVFNQSEARLLSKRLNEFLQSAR